MNYLLWLVNHPLRGNVVGILTSQNPDTPKGFENRFSIRILTDLPHSTKPELEKTPSNPNGFQQSFHARATLRTLDKLGSPLALRTSPLFLLYNIELGSTIGG
jgi:hypothetical protein